jgi:hypothetical protein
MLVCDGAKRWRRHGRGSRAESQSGVIMPSLATTVIGPLSAQETPCRAHRLHRQAGNVDILWRRIRSSGRRGGGKIAVLVAMNIMLLSGVQQLLPAPTSLVLLMLLALGSFLAGLNLASLELCFLGLVLALAVPAVSWVKQSILFVILAGAFVVGIGTTFWSSRKEK